MTEPALPWDDIPASTGTLYSSKRITDCPHRFWWIVDANQRIGIVFEIGSELEIPKELKDFSNIEIKFNSTALVLILDDPELKTKFRVLCHDIITQSQEVPKGKKQEVTESVFSCLKRWKKLFTLEKRSQPSLSVIIGAIGELYYLANFIAFNTDFRTAVDAWHGPKGHEQDFLINGYLLEVKTQLASSDSVIKINSLDQLDIISGPIYLVHLGLSRCPPSTPESFSINGLINTILNGLNRDNLGIDIFMTLLGHLGFFRDNEFGNEHFTLSFDRIYEVSEDFPVITRQNINSSIIAKARYNINASKLTPWLAEKDEVVERIYHA